MFTMLFKCYFNNQTEFECYLSGNKWDTCTYKAHNSLLCHVYDYFDHKYW